MLAQPLETPEAWYVAFMLSGLFGGPLAVGAEAPDFELPDQDGKAVRLSALRGKNVVLVFYPGDDTPVCTKQLCEFRDGWAEARQKNTVVFGVNPWSAGSHSKFRAKFKLPFPLLVDKGQRVGSLYRTNSLLVRRTVYLIGPDGRIRFAERGKPDAKNVLAAAT
jgi:peroxiredoxin Q/BCP